LISQAFTNLLKNAAEAIDTKIESGVSDFKPNIRVSATTGPARLEIRIQDNGIGLPQDTARLFEPYVTNRDKGTGLGLSIVRKIVEDHHGTLELRPAPIFDDSENAGAEAFIVLPLPHEVATTFPIEDK
jgi:two-component system nitrogen regulation sensor histidine kinase NtrY